MTPEDKWTAVATNDESFDGVFFYAVRSTGIFCRPSCKSRLPRRENVVFYDHASQAMRDGYRPCKRCRPDLVEYRPVREIAEKARHFIDRHFSKSEHLEVELNGLGVSPRRLKRIFRDEYGQALGEYIISLRIREAQRMLTSTRDTVTSICFTVGFNSLSAFYSSFKENTGISPAKYRKEQISGRQEVRT